MRYFTSLAYSFSYRNDIASLTWKADTIEMAQKSIFYDWQNSLAITTAIVAVLAALTSFQASSTSSALLLEKNNANTYQSKANKEWNTYLANDITDRALKHPSDQIAQQTLKTQAEELEHQADEATAKANVYFENN